MSKFEKLFKTYDSFKFDNNFRNNFNKFKNSINNNINKLNSNIDKTNKTYNKNLNRINIKKYEIDQLNKLIKEYEKQLEYNSEKIISNEKIIQNDVQKNKNIIYKLMISIGIVCILSILIIYHFIIFFI